MVCSPISVKPVRIMFIVIIGQVIIVKMVVKQIRKPHQLIDILRS